jgi:ribosome maturation factor RimP
MRGGAFVPSERVTDIVERMALPIVQGEGLELVDVEYKKEGSNWFLRVFIDKEAGVDIDDCGRVSEQLSDLLDEVDPIQNPYFLEVSSPGAERPLKKSADYDRAVGKQIHVSLYEPMNQEKVYQGLLEQFDGDELKISWRVKGVQKRIVIPMEKVASARLAVEL